MSDSVGGRQGGTRRDGPPGGLVSAQESARCGMINTTATGEGEKIGGHISARPEGQLPAVVDRRATPQDAGAVLALLGQIWPPFVDPQPWSAAAGAARVGPRSQSHKQDEPRNRGRGRATSVVGVGAG